MLITFVLSLFAIYLLIGLVAMLFGLFCLGSAAYHVHKHEQSKQQNIQDKKEAN